VAVNDLAAPRVLELLRAAVEELSWLLGRGYRRPLRTSWSGRHQLAAPLRAAMIRCACSPEAQARRSQHEVAAPDLPGKTLAVDAYNVITTVQVALADGLVLLGRDGCARDLASIHGCARDPEEQLEAAWHVGGVLDSLGLAAVRWYLDRPVSRSAELGEQLTGLARERGWRWTADLVQSPDGVLARTADVAATSDSAVLDRCASWFNLARAVVEACAPGARVIDLSG
jgi:hypothetical protein